jgi:hypothetical protein
MDTNRDTTSETVKKFNYCVAHYWEDGGGQIGPYTYFNTIFFGTTDEANDFLEYVKQQSPEYDWKIFQILEMQ